MTDDEILQQTICLIPSRKGSVRVPGKNTRLLGGVPLVAWTIRQAGECDFGEVWIASDDPNIVHPYRDRGWNVFPRQPVSPTQPDLEWVTEMGRGDYFSDYQWFCILRPTSPFRQSASIREAVCKLARSGADSLRGIRKVKEHPAKMWTKEEGLIVRPFRHMREGRLNPYDEDHDLPYQSLPEVYVQDSSIHVAKTSLLPGTMTGNRVLGYELPGMTGFAIDDEMDWKMAEMIVAGLNVLKFTD